MSRRGEIQEFLLRNTPKQRYDPRLGGYRYDRGVTANVLTEAYIKSDPTTPNIVEPYHQTAVRRALRNLEAQGLMVRHRAGPLVLWFVKTKTKPRPRVVGKLRKPRETPQHRARAQLAKVLGMAGSAHEGEALAAIRKADSLRRKLGLSWDDLIRK
jgi:hypothetical protein